ncbi:unnamed protein product, partial [Musa acuminata var. zebrina]
MATCFNNMNEISTTCVPCLALDFKKKIDIHSSLNTKCIIPNNRKY